MVMCVAWRCRFVAIASEPECPVSAWSVMLTPKEEASWEGGTEIGHAGIFVLALPSRFDGRQTVYYKHDLA